MHPPNMRVARGLLDAPSQRLSIFDCLLNMLVGMPRHSCSFFGIRDQSRHKRPRDPASAGDQNSTIGIILPLILKDRNTGEFGMRRLYSPLVRNEKFHTNPKR